MKTLISRDGARLNRYFRTIFYTLSIGTVLFASSDLRAQDAKIVETDMQIDAIDPGIKLFLREKMNEGIKYYRNAATSLI